MDVPLDYERRLLAGLLVHGPHDLRVLDVPALRDAAADDGDLVPVIEQVVHAREAGGQPRQLLCARHLRLARGRIGYTQGRKHPDTHGYTTHATYNTTQNYSHYLKCPETPPTPHKFENALMKTSGIQTALRLERKK